MPGISRKLAKRYRVIRFDHRGHGLSSKPHNDAAYGANLADDAIRLMDHLGIQKAHIVGYSMGGMISLTLLARYPERLLSAAPCACGWMLPDAANMALLKALSESLDAGRSIKPLADKLRPPGQTHDDIPTWIVNHLIGWINDQKALACVVRSWLDLMVTEDQLRANQVPVLSIAGTADPLKEGVDNMTGILANHQPVSIEGTNHLTTILNRKFMASLLSFLTQHGETKKA